MLIHFFIAALLQVAPNLQTAPPEAPDVIDTPDIVARLDTRGRGLSRCLNRLEPGTRYSPTLVCRVNSIGRPADCVVESSEDLSPEQRLAAVCVFRGYEIRTRDGRPARDRRVRMTIHLVVP